MAQSPQLHFATGTYCRQCGFDLRGQPPDAPRCPECGRVFDPADPKTFRNRPLHGASWRWMKRRLVAILIVVLLLAGTWGWMYWDWHEEQAALAAIATMRASIGVHPLVGSLRSDLGPAGFVLDRVDSVQFPEETKDADLVHLKKLKGLKVLGLSFTKVTDAGLVHLKELKGVRHLYLHGTEVTESGKAELRQALPGCSVD